MSEPVSWHRLFGLSLIDLCRGLPVTVELEKDLSLKQQLLDVVLIRAGLGPLPRLLPDGLAELVAYNLLTFKSYQEALDAWALLELIGHYVNFRKQVSPSMQQLLPETDFRLFAVCVRFPQALARVVPLQPVQPGVYQVDCLGTLIRILVVHELPQTENNALLHLFSARSDLLKYGRAHYRQRSPETSTLLVQFLTRYQLEGIAMPDALEEFTRQAIDELLKELPPERRLKGLSAEQVLAALPNDEILKQLPPERLLKQVPAEDRLRGLPAAERLKGLTAEQVLAALPIEVRLALTARLRDEESSSAGDA